MAASALMFSLAAPFALAQAPSVAACIGFQPVGGTAASTAQTCADIARGRDSRRQAARAYFNAAQGEFNAFQGDGDVARLARAAGHLGQSLGDLPNSEISTLTFRNYRDEIRGISDSKDRPPLVRERDWPALRSDFIYRRTMLHGQVHRDLAEAHAGNRVPPGTAVPCANAGDCAEAALARLEADQGFLNLTPGAAASNYHMLRGDLLRHSRRPNAQASALAAYSQAAESGRDLPQEAAAKARAENLALALGGDAAPEGASAGQLANAISFYDQALRVNPNSLPALMGKGKAFAALGGMGSRDEASRRSDYASAVSTFAAAITAAGSDQAGLAQAYVQSGLARSNWAGFLGTRPGGAGNAEAAQLRELAAGDFRQALSAGGNQFEILEPLAGVLGVGGGASEELKTVNLAVIKAALNLPAGASWTVPANQAERDAFRGQVGALPQNRRDAIARALIGLGPDQENNLLAAEIAAPLLVGPPLQLAELYTRRQNTQPALTRIGKVLELTQQSAAGVAKAGMEADRARAHFLRSRIRFTSQAAGNLVVEDADNALRLMPGEAVYANWACAARIVAGGDFVRGAAVNSGCAGLATEEREALRGMFMLRAAQHATRAADRREFLNQAQLAFRGGDARLSDLGEVYRTRLGQFDWGPDNQETKRLRSILRYGEAVAVACSGGTTSVFLQLSGDETKHAKDFFIWHRVDVDAC